MDDDNDQDYQHKMDDEKESLLPSRRPSLLNFSITFEQLMFVIIIILPSLAPGMSVGYSSIALPELKLNLVETSWFASLPTLGSIVGNFATGYIIDRCGRKISFFANTIPAFIGYILVASSRDLLYLYSGMFSLGFAQGAATLVATVYIAESMAPDNLHFRSSLASWNVLAMTSGVALTYFLGYLLRYDSVALVGASLALISSIFVLVFIPESPAWLAQQGRHKEAEQARRQLGCAADVESSTSYQCIDDHISMQDNFYSYLMNIKRRDVYKPLIATVVFFFFQQFSGTQIYAAFMVDIVTVNSITINPYLTTLICGIIMEIGQISYTILLPQIGLRKIAIISTVFSSATTLLLGVCIQLNNTVTWYSHIVDCIHIFSVWCNVYITAMGMGTIPYAIVGEIFPVEAKGFASIPVFSVAAFYFINLWIYPGALTLSTYAIYYFYAIVGFLAIPFIYYCIPETVGRTLQQISLEFSK